MKIYTLAEIKLAIDLKHNFVKLIESQKQAFIDFSAGVITLPSPIQLRFEDVQGDCHIKAGFRESDDIFVVKVATGFYQNPKNGLPSSDGVMLIFSQETGRLQAILCDGGYLTTLRTGLAAALASSLTSQSCIGIIGTGNLASLVAGLMRQLYPTTSIAIWGRDLNKASIIARDHHITLSSSLEDIVTRGGLVVTTTASHQPMIYDYHITNPTHIVALGADELGKQELDVSVIAAADKVIVDSKVQAAKFGDSSYAVAAGAIDVSKFEELGNVLKQGVLNKRLIVTDLTGLAAQDIAIAQFVAKQTA